MVLSIEITSDSNIDYTNSSIGIQMIIVLYNFVLAIRSDIYVFLSENARCVMITPQDLCYPSYLCFVMVIEIHLEIVQEKSRKLEFRFEMMR